MVISKIKLNSSNDHLKLVTISNFTVERNMFALWYKNNVGLHSSFFPAADPFLRQSIFGELELSLVILDTV